MEKHSNNFIGPTSSDYRSVLFFTELNFFPTEQNKGEVTGTFRLNF
jgi:hypothetical protein